MYALRRKDLLQAIKQAYPDVIGGCVVLFADFEIDSSKFRQESTFYYYTGIAEPGLVLTLDLDGASTLYTPCHTESRSKWVKSSIELTQDNAKKLGLDSIVVLGQQCPGYQFGPFSSRPYYAEFLKKIEELVAKKGTLFVLNPDNAYEYIGQRFVLNRIHVFVPEAKSNVINISGLIAKSRQKKDMHEIDLLHAAIDITTMAHEAAAQSIKSGALECEVQASLEYIFTASGARPAFASIVASGPNTTILHYTQNKDTLKDGDLVIVDIGAEYNYYCADLTRTYPVSGTFTKRQRQLYNIVLEAQQYIADLVKPGYWLSNKEKPDKSLHHLAKEFLKNKGYDQYFTHGLGHHLGLDVHDVGDYTMPLQEGDVITIEPGIYIPEEGIGIRIEDDYWIVKEGAVCLSEQLPKTADQVEKMVQQGFKDAMQNEDEVLFEPDDEFEPDVDLEH